MKTIQKILLTGVILLALVLLFSFTTSAQTSPDNPLAKLEAVEAGTLVPATYEAVSIFVLHSQTELDIEGMRSISLEDFEDHLTISNQASCAMIFSGSTAGSIHVAGQIAQQLYKAGADPLEIQNALTAVEPKRFALHILDHLTIGDTRGDGGFVYLSILFSEESGISCYHTIEIWRGLWEEEIVPATVEKNNLSALYNESTQILNLKSETMVAGGIAHLRIFDTLGKVIVDNQNFVVGSPIAIPKSSPGSYIASLSSGTLSESAQFVVTR